MTATQYTLDEFIHDMTDLVAAQPDQAVLFDRGSRLIERLVRHDLQSGKISSYVLGKYDNC